MDSELLFDDWQFLMFYTYAKNVLQIDAKILLLSFEHNMNNDQ